MPPPKIPSIFSSGKTKKMKPKRSSSTERILTKATNTSIEVAYQQAPEAFTIFVENHFALLEITHGN